MRVDLGNALADVSSPGLSRDALTRLDDDVAAAHERIEASREADEFGYTALDLPRRTDTDAIRTAVSPVREATTVLTIGIGGSALGAATLAAGLGEPGHRVLDNVDPAEVMALLDDIALDETAIHVVSRSGTTAETLANFLVVRDAMAAAGIDWTDRTIVTTGNEGPLRRLANRHDLPVLSVPEGVPGRFSVLSSVGLVPAAILGHDIDAILAGAREAADDLSGSLFDCPSYAYGAASEALARRGVAITAMMPYAERLERFAEWFAQLWAESLGKDGLGQLPAQAIGATDQHSQLQRYRAGPRNTMVTFVRPRHRPDRPIPAPDTDALGFLKGTTLGELIDIELEATEASLAAAGRPSVRVEVPRLDERGLGDLLYGMQAACVLAGELAGIDAFDQPAVEWGKAATRDLLAGVDNERTQSIEGKTELVVE